MNSPPAATAAIEARQVVAIAGACVLFLGAFAPLASVPIVGSISYFLSGRGDGVLIALWALLAVMLARRKAYPWLLVPGGLSVLQLIWVLWAFGLRKDAIGATSEIGKGIAAVIQISWGWALMMIGALAITLCSDVSIAPARAWINRHARVLLILAGVVVLISLTLWASAHLAAEVVSRLAAAEARDTAAQKAELAARQALVDARRMAAEQAQARRSEEESRALEAERKAREDAELRRQTEVARQEEEEAARREARNQAKQLAAMQAWHQNQFLPRIQPLASDLSTVAPFSLKPPDSTAQINELHRACLRLAQSISAARNMQRSADDSVNSALADTLDWYDRAASKCANGDYPEFRRSMANGNAAVGRLANGLSKYGLFQE